MNKNLFESFPYALIKIDKNGNLIRSNQRSNKILKQLDISRLNFILDNKNPPGETHIWFNPQGKKYYIEKFVVEGSSNTLILIGEDIDFSLNLPSTFEEKLENFTTDPYTVTQKIAELIKDALTFERFDLLRVDQNLRKYTYEYSIGIDIEGTLHTAFSSITNSGLGWIVKNESSYLVEKMDLDHFNFREDPLLYQTGFRSILRVPILFDQGVVGAILLASFEPNRFQIEDAMLLNQISKFIAQSYYNAGILQQNEYQTIVSSSLLHTVVTTISDQTIEDFLLEYCSQLRAISLVDRVGISLIDNKINRRRCIVEAGKEITRFGEWIPITSSGGIAKMLESKSAVAFNFADPKYVNIEETLIDSGFTAILYVPIENFEGQIIAALTVVTSDEKALSSSTAKLFKIAAEQLTHFLGKLMPKLQDRQARRQFDSYSIPKGFKNIIGSSESIRNTIQKASVAAKYDFPILLTGETGTGKELFAKAIHESSPYSNGPFIVVNSAAIPSNLLESELFGYHEGAFTGGLKGGKKGKVLLADGGTLFLDEIGELPSDLQAKLLRVIQEHEVEPLGSSKPIPINTRIISATNRNLSQMVKNGEFREDLLYRLNSIEIMLPPLRERGKDVLELADYMLNFLANSHGTAPKIFSADSEQKLLNYNWPGNVRQLQNIINRLFVFVEGRVIHVHSLPPEIRKFNTENTNLENEREKLERLLIEFQGNKTAMAHYLGITRTGLWKKLKRLGLQ